LLEFEPFSVKKYLPIGRATPSSSTAIESVAVVAPTDNSVASAVVKSAAMLAVRVDMYLLIKLYKSIINLSNIAD
jgi:hypothetical protein